MSGAALEFMFAGFAIFLAQDHNCLIAGLQSEEKG